MTIQMHKTRVFAGHDDQGNPRFQFTVHPGPRPPESEQEWAEQQVARIGGLDGIPAGKVAVGLLLAESDGELAAAVKAGKRLDKWARYGVLSCLRVCRERAGGTPGAARAARIVAAWTRAYGSAEPRPV